MNVEAVDAALGLLRRASRLERRLDAYFSNQGLSQLRFLILIVLDRENNDAVLKASDIAERLDISRPVMTRTLQALAKERAVAFSEHDEDGRARIVSLTTDGRARLHAALPGYYDILDAFMRNDPIPA